MNKALRIIYMGTPEFAVPSLDILVKNGFNVVAVVTVPDKPSGRGLQLNPSPVKTYALENNIPVLQPEKLKDEDFQRELKSYEADLQVVVAFRMLPEAVWNMPRLGTLNLHASLLPDYRGAAPINWAIINGETETGCTTFFLKHEIDTGDIIFQFKLPILPEDNIGTLYEKQMTKGAELTLQTITAIQEGNYPRSPQPIVAEPKLAPKIFKETCKIDWSKSAVEIHNLVRGLSPYPAAFTSINDKSCKVFETSIFDENKTGEIGKLSSDGKTFIHFQTAKGVIEIKSLQMEGKKRMVVDEFLRGNRLV
jgi:methionyl-tRNA formyltransferase